MQAPITRTFDRRPQAWQLAAAALAALLGGAAAARGLLPTAALLVLLLGIPATALFLRRLDYGVALVLLTLLPGQLVRLSLGTDARGGAAMLLADLLLPLVVGAWLLRKATAEQRFPRSAITVPLVVFLMVALLSLLAGVTTVFGMVDAPGKPLLVAALYLVRLWMYAGFFFVALDALRTAALVRRFLRLLIWIAVLLAVGGFFQLWLYPDFTQFAISAGWDPHQGRLLSSFFDPNFMGTFLAMNLLVIMALVLDPEQSPRLKRWCVAAGVVIGVGMLLTYSRGALLGFLAGFALIGLLRSPRLLFTGLAVMVLSIAAIPRLSQRVTEGLSVDETGVKRIESWTKAVKLVAARPVLGTGYNALAPVQDALGLVDEFDVNNRGGVENSLLSVAVTTGLVGLLSFVVLYLTMVGVALRAWGDRLRTSGLRHLGLGVGAALVCVLFASITLNAILYPFILLEIWTLLAAVERSRQLEEEAALAPAQGPA